MSDTDNNPPLQRDDFAKTPRKNSSSIMAITIILLTITFAYSSILIAKTAIAPQQKETNQGTEQSSHFNPFKSSPAHIEATNQVAETEIKKNKDTSSGFFSFTRKDGKVRWPKLKLSGCGTTLDGNGGFAIINGHQIMQGETVNKVTLIEVHPPQHVVVEYKGEQKKLTVLINKK